MHVLDQRCPSQPAQNEGLYRGEGRGGRWCVIRGGRCGGVPQGTSIKGPGTDVLSAEHTTAGAASGQCWPLSCSPEGLSQNTSRAGYGFA